MKKYERKEVISKAEVLVELSCDLCGSKSGIKNDFSNQWASDYSRLEEITLERISYGWDSETRTKQQFDVCPRCWETVILPLFEARGVKPRETGS